jgi:hypothetical protein
MLTPPNKGPAVSFEKVAIILVRVLCLAQQVIIGLVTFVVALFPVVHQEPATPWAGPIVKTVAAIAIVTISYWICRKALRSLDATCAANPIKGPLALANLIVGLAFTPFALIFLYISFLFSHGPIHPPHYWGPIAIGGTCVSAFAILCWFWWATVILAHDLLRKGFRHAPFFIAPFPFLVAVTSWVILAGLCVSHRLLSWPWKPGARSEERR